jgi:porin-like protein
MKMVKSLLLGSAAGLVAVSAGQAADLPVKAKPVEYVKVCSLYGAGFYYMPGTDICLKIGGYARAETTYHSNGNFAAGPTGNEIFNRTTNEFVMRARAYITADAREQTAWGTARAYVAVGVATTDTGAAITPSILGFNRAFIQWAGITAGITQSFFDFYSGAATGYRAYFPNEDTGDSGWWVWAYTAQLGNGLSASISAEERRTSQIINVTSGTHVGFVSGTVIADVGGVPTVVARTSGLGTPGLFAAGAPNSNGTISGQVVNTAGYGGIQSPDIVGNIRLDQTWGSAQIMAAAHEVNANYYDTHPATGHPGDQWGYVVGAGLRLNFPMIAQGDFFQGEVNYTHGALRYLMMGDNSPNMQIGRGNTYGFGVTSDCVFGSLTSGAQVASSGTNVNGQVVGATGTTGCQLTTAWSFNAAYEHYWTPQFHQSFEGGLVSVRYNAIANAQLCAVESGSVPTSTALALPTGSGAVAPAGCNNNWNLWTVGTRLQYDFTKTLYFGVEFLYQHLDSASLPGNHFTSTTQIGAVAPPGNGLAPGASIKDQNVLAITARIHKDFLP